MAVASDIPVLAVAVDASLPPALIAISSFPLLDEVALSRVPRVLMFP